MKHSRPRFGNSSQGGPASNRKLGSAVGRHKAVAGVTGFTKRTVDVILAGVGLVVLAPVLAILAIAVRITDSGPALFRQIRVGVDRKRFTMLKFRTMHENAEADLGAIWAVPGDPRCSRIGHFLRRCGLDELPQLWNVLRGDMSLVGPRPERPEFTREFRREHPSYDLRHAVRPGMTGYAQIYGWRGYTSLEERLHHDLYYVRHWSLLLDAYILAMLPVRGWSEKTRQGVN